MKSPLIVLLLLSIGLCSFACQHGKDKTAKSTVSADKVAEEYEPLERALLLDPRFQPDVKMRAEAEGETVTVQIQNFSDVMLGVDAQNFAVIREGETGTTHPFDPDRHSATFPKIGLPKGQIASGTLTFSGMGKLAGQRLVFSHTKVRPSITYITGEGAKPIAVPKVRPTQKKPAK